MGREGEWDERGGGTRGGMGREGEGEEGNTSSSDCGGPLAAMSAYENSGLVSLILSAILGCRGGGERFEEKAES